MRSQLHVIDAGYEWHWELCTGHTGQKSVGRRGPGQRTGGGAMHILRGTTCKAGTAPIMPPVPRRRHADSKFVAGFGSSRWLRAPGLHFPPPVQHDSAGSISAGEAAGVHPGKAPLATLPGLRRRLSLVCGIRPGTLIMSIHQATDSLLTATPPRQSPPAPSHLLPSTL